MRKVAYFVNGIVVIIIGFELLLLLFGRINANQLLLSSILSGLSVIISFKLLKDGLLNMYGLDDSKREQIKAEINFLDAINSHIQHKAKLQEYVEGYPSAAAVAPPDCSDDRCELGLWINGPARNHFEDNEKIQVLRNRHSRFHAIAGDIIRLTQENDRAAAARMLSGEYRRAAHELTMALTELNKLIEDKVITA